MAQSYAPAPGEPGSTAIHKDSSIILSWANTCEVERGLLNIDDPQGGYADFGDPQNGAGKAEGNAADVVSLGDAGIATLSFNPPIADLEGPDFCVFENGFADNYMELAFVEVSSNGVDFYRFPSISEVPLNPQQTNGSFSDCRYVHNLAGKYRAGYGTPFDLEDLDSITDLDRSSITHIRLIDVIGKVGNNGSRDSQGNYINDPFPTPFSSGGFDLDAVGVMNEGLLALKEDVIHVRFNNPFESVLKIDGSKLDSFVIMDVHGKVMATKRDSYEVSMINTSEWKSGLYFLVGTDKKGLETTFRLRRL